MDEIFVGIELGGTNIKIGCFDEQLTILKQCSFHTCVELGPESIVSRIAETVEWLLKSQGLSARNIIAAAIGSPGVIDIENGIVVVTSNLRFENVPLRQMVSDKLKCPVILENDANITCWGEYIAGAGQGADDMILITLGTGIGGGIIANGELVHGCGNNAAELGHIIIHRDGRLCGCGQRGCVEAYASASATVARAVEALDLGRPSLLRKILDNNGCLTGKDIYDCSASGDELAREITDGTANALAIFCINLFHLTGPKRIVFYGGMIAAGDLLLEPIRRFFNKNIWTIKSEKLEFCFATLGVDAGIIGTAALAIHAKNKGWLK